MRYFFDTEFIEDGKTIDLISIGIVAEDGREFYGISREADLTRANAWVKEHVIAKLPTDVTDPAYMSRAQLREGILTIVGNDEHPQFWAYYSAYDWIALCQLFGTMMDLPKGFPMFCRDLKQLSNDVGKPRHPPDPVGEHDALIDARWSRDLFSFLRPLATWEPG